MIETGSDNHKNCNRNVVIYFLFITNILLEGGLHTTLMDMAGINMFIILKLYS